MENEPKNRSEWFLIIEQYQKNDLTQLEFCKRNNLMHTKFIYYLQSYRKQNNVNTKKERPSFSEMTVKQPITNSPEIKIDLPNGFRCYIPSSISSEVIKKVLGALLTC